MAVLKAAIGILAIYLNSVAAFSINSSAVNLSDAEVAKRADFDHPNVDIHYLREWESENFADSTALQWVDPDGSCLKRTFSKGLSIQPDLGVGCKLYNTPDCDGDPLFPSIDGFYYPGAGNTKKDPRFKKAGMVGGPLSMWCKVVTFDDPPTRVSGAP